MLRILHQLYGELTPPFVGIVVAQPVKIHVDVDN